MTRVYYKQDFVGMSQLEIEMWIKFNYQRLIGSAIFTKSNSVVSKIVQWAERWRNKEDRFVPSHTGSLVEKNGYIYIMDVKPPKNTVQPLSYYLAYTEEDYAIVMRDFDIDTKLFSLNILERVGEWYPIMSAVRSVFTKRKTAYKSHCSEHHARTLQRLGYEFPKEFNLECTPDELFQYFINKD